MCEESGTWYVPYKLEYQRMGKDNYNLISKPFQLITKVKI